MRNQHLFLNLVLVLLLGSVARAGNWNFPVGLSYLSGFKDLHNQYEDNLRFEGYSVRDDTMIPFGFSFTPFYQYDNGLRLGGGIGPTMVIWGERDHFELPLSLDTGYTFLKDENTAPYVRLGLSYHLATGDYEKGSELGLLAGVGVEFLRHKKVSVGFELTYDGAPVKVENKRAGTTDKIKTGEFMAKIYILL